jgi:YgiT-type zinc finger domain-containing protein
MICDACGKKGAAVKHISRTYGKGHNMLVIDDVPVVVCPKCGESYLTSETLQEIERLKLHRKSFRTQRVAPVITYV